MKKILPHLVFIVAIGLVPYGYNESYEKARSGLNHIGVQETDPAHLNVGDFIPYIAISVVIIFFLWKNNYFTRNKS